MAEPAPASADQEVAHEALDLRPNAVFGILGAFIALVLVLVAGVTLLTSQLRASNGRAARPLTAAQSTPLLPQGLRLKPRPERDLAAMHERERALVQSYGRVGVNGSRARIPLALAQQLAIGRGLDEPLP